MFPYNAEIDPNFSCLKMKEEIQAKIYEETKDMTNEEFLAYLNKKLENSPFKHIREKYETKKHQPPSS